MTLEWVASPVNDMYADAVLSSVLQAESIDTPKYIPSSATADRLHFKECLIEMLQVQRDHLHKITTGRAVSRAPSDFPRLIALV